MRLLGWMHHKLRQTGIEPFRSLTTGNYCSCFSAKSRYDGHLSQARPSFGYNPQKEPDEESENAYSDTEAKQSEENCEDAPSMVFSELFHGFLAIGTLGSEPIISEPETPTFPMYMGNITETKAEVTESDLKLINNELEKFLEAEAEEEGCNDSLARSSCVSAITFSGMETEGINAEYCRKTVICPLQDYLFGSLIELPETRIEPKKERVSLGEMFRRTKVADEILARKEGAEDMKTEGPHRSAKHIIKKMLKKFHASSENPTPSVEDAANFISVRKRMKKVLKIFHRKVHPEDSMSEEELNKYHKEKMKKTLHNHGCNADMIPRDKGKRNFLAGNKPMEGINRHNNLNLPQYDLRGGNSNGNKEYWIKTDADYLVLEL